MNINFEISNDQNNLTVLPQEKIELQFVEFDHSLPENRTKMPCNFCHFYQIGFCADRYKFPCKPEFRTDGKDGYFAIKQ